MPSPSSLILLLILPLLLLILPLLLLLPPEGAHDVGRDVAHPPLQLGLVVVVVVVVVRLSRSMLMVVTFSLSSK